MKIAVVGACSGGINLLEYLGGFYQKKDIGIYFWGKKEDIPKKYTNYGKNYYGYKICGMYDEIPSGLDVYLSMGNLNTKEEYYQYFSDCGYRLPNIIHNSSYIASDVYIPDDSGIHILANSLIQMGSKIHPNVLINNMVLIDHECEIYSSSHIAGGCNLASNIIIGKRTLIGTGSSIHHGVRIGDDCIVGIGSNITRDIPSNSFIPVYEQRRRDI